MRRFAEVFNVSVILFVPCWDVYGGARCTHMVWYAFEMYGVEGKFRTLREDVMTEWTEENEIQQR